MPTPSTPWFAATLGLAGLIVGYTVANGFNGVALPIVPDVPSAPTVPDAPVPPPANDTPATVDDDPVIGDDNAPITLIEFTDYQCPFCGRHYGETYGKIKADYVDSGKVKIVVRDFPLGFHPHAQKTAEATECADDQGKFEEMHDTIFEAQAIWSSAADVVPTLKQYAKDLGLNTSEFDSCLDSGAHAQEVQDDMADGSASGISGTPGFWILGPDGQSQKISGAYPYETFKAAFDGMLN